jgi:hypothetical protein
MTELPATQHLADDIVHPDDTTIREIINDLAPVVSETKAGYKTTEFWVALLGIVLAQIGVLHLPGKYGDTITTVALAAGYVLSRGFAKGGVPNVTPSAAAIAPAEEIVQREVSST